ncbi:MAG: hypothetical protein EXR11_03550, partial [Rhodospirillaceae bacterium]|nr:hypothetical protein [Rhodospirillaceae bacterium]
MQNQKSVRIFTAAVVLTATFAGVATEAFAQIEEIVVTTRKREENLQDVPIVITAFSAASIERKGIASLEDVAKYTNGLILSDIPRMNPGFRQHGRRKGRLLQLRGYFPGFSAKSLLNADFSARRYPYFP